MKMKFKTIEGSVIAPIGFLAGGVFCDIKRLGTGKGSDKGQKRDLAMKKYEIVLAENGNTAPAEQARKHIREAYRE